MLFASVYHTKMKLDSLCSFSPTEPPRLVDALPRTRRNIAQFRLNRYKVKVYIRAFCLSHIGSFAKPLQSKNNISMCYIYDAHIQK